MAKSTQQICISLDRLNWLTNMQKDRKLKNISETIETIFEDYIAIELNIGRIMRQKEEEERRRSQADEFAASYKKQIIAKS